MCLAVKLANNALIYSMKFQLDNKITAWYFNRYEQITSFLALASCRGEISFYTCSCSPLEKPHSICQCDQHWKYCAVITMFWFDWNDARPYHLIFTTDSSGGVDTTPTCKLVCRWKLLLAVCRFACLNHWINKQVLVKLALPYSACAQVSIHGLINISQLRQKCMDDN